MRHRKAGSKLGMGWQERKRLFRMQSISLILNERITTTEAKATRKMSRLDQHLEAKLTDLALALVDQYKARVAIPPQQSSTGFWFGGGNLVAHQGEQGGDDDGGPPAPVAQHAGGREVDRRLAEAGAGDQQGALSPGDDCGHRVELLGPGVGVGPGERPNVGGELVGDLGGGGAGRFGERGHLSTVPMPGDSRTGGRCRPASTLLTSAPLRPYLQGREANSAAIASYTTR